MFVFMFMYTYRPNIIGPCLIKHTTHKVMQFMCISVKFFDLLGNISDVVCGQFVREATSCSFKTVYFLWHFFTLYRLYCSTLLCLPLYRCGRRWSRRIRTVLFARSAPWSAECGDSWETLRNDRTSSRSQTQRYRKMMINTTNRQTFKTLLKSHFFCLAFDIS